MRALILVIPVVNVAAALVWAVSGEDAATRRLGWISLAALTAITAAAGFYGYSGLQILLEAVR